MGLIRHPLITKGQRCLTTNQWAVDAISIVVSPYHHQPRPPSLGCLYRTVSPLPKTHVVSLAVERPKLKLKQGAGVLIISSYDSIKPKSPAMAASPPRLSGKHSAYIFELRKSLSYCLKLQRPPTIALEQHKASHANRSQRGGCGMLLAYTLACVRISTIDSGRESP